MPPEKFDRFTKPLLWELGPSHEFGAAPPMLCGDRLLIAVALSKGGYCYEVIEATETGWDDVYGESWGSWSFDDVSFFVRLDKPRTKEEIEECE